MYKMEDVRKGIVLDIETEEKVMWDEYWALKAMEADRQYWAYVEFMWDCQYVYDDMENLYEQYWAL